MTSASPSQGQAQNPTYHKWEDESYIAEIDNKAF